MSERKSLSDAFAPAPKESRGTGLAGILGAAPATDLSSSLPARVNELSASGTNKTPSVRAKRSSTRREPAIRIQKVARPDDVVATVPAYLELDVADALKNRTRAEGGQYADVLLDAFDGVDHEDLGLAIAPAALPVEAGKAPRRPRGNTRQITAKVQINFQLTGAQEQWLNDLQRQFDSSNRSAFYNAGLRIWLFNM